MSLTEQDKLFKEQLGGFFHDMLRASGITPAAANSVARIRAVGERMAGAIEHAAERKAIQVIKKLQTAVMKAFIDMEAELNATKKLVGKNNELIGQILKLQKKVAEEELEAARREKERQAAQDEV